MLCCAVVVTQVLAGWVVVLMFRGTETPVGADMCLSVLIGARLQAEKDKEIPEYEGVRLLFMIKCRWQLLRN